MCNVKRFRPNLYIIVEGNDYIFLKAFLNVIQEKYNVKLFVASGKDRIISKLKSTKPKYPDSPVLIFFDLDGKGMRRIDRFLEIIEKKGLEDFICRDEIFFVNPCIEYLFVVAKKNRHPKVLCDAYKSMMNKLYNFDHYIASTEQVEKIVRELTEDNFQNLIKNLSNISSDPNKLPSSDIGRLIDYIQNLDD